MEAKEEWRREKEENEEELEESPFFFYVYVCSNLEEGETQKRRDVLIKNIKIHRWGREMKEINGF